MLGRVVLWGGLFVLLTAVLLQQPVLHQLLFHSAAIEPDEEVILYPTIARLLDVPAR